MRLKKFQKKIVLWNIFLKKIFTGEFLYGNVRFKNHNIIIDYINIWYTIYNKLYYS